MKMVEEKRTEKEKHPSLNRQLLTYSLAAGTVLAMAQPAGAAVECSSPGNVIIDEGNPGVDIDLDDDGQADFHFSFSIFTTGGDQLKSINVAGINHPSNAFLGSFGTGYTPNVRVLSQGYAVHMFANPWLSNAYGILNGCLYTSAFGSEIPFGNFSGGQGCFGVKFYSEKHDANGALHFGWVEYEGSTPGEPVSGEVISWGYETEPGTSISACECQSRGPIEEPTSSEPIPSLNPLGLLILAGLILAGGGAAMNRRKRE